jgi:FKBP-type peptidyl-prolyl cis-trans isomerase
LRRAPLIAAGFFVLVIVVVAIAVTSSSSSTTQASASDNIGQKPDVTVPSEPATKLEKIDVVTGTGATAQTGDTVSVQYVGVSQSNGQEFDASWDRGQPSRSSSAPAR